MMIKNKKEKAERKIFLEILSDAYKQPEQDPDFTRRVMRKARYNRPMPLFLRICNRATAFFCSPLLIFIAIGIGVFLLRDELVALITGTCDGQLSCPTQGMQSILVLGSLLGLILFACKEMIRETDN